MSEEPLIPEGMSVPDVKFDMGEVPEDAAKLFAPIPMSKVKSFLHVTSVLLFVFGCFVIAIAARTDDRNARNSNIIIGFVMLSGASVSMYATHYEDRGGLQLVWLLNIWQMATGTKLIYAALGSFARFADICAMTAEDEEEEDKCESDKLIVTLQAIVITLAWFTALINAWLSSNLSEKVQDSRALVERKRDIRFALAKQALSLKVASQWKRAFLKVRSVLRWKRAEPKKGRVGGSFKLGRSFAKNED